MVRYRGYQEIIFAIIKQLELTQPLLDTKPGSVARDLFIDAQGQQISNIHELLRELSQLQSLANLTGEDLTNFGFNFGVTRNSGTKSNGSVLFTFRDLTTDITIPSETIVSTRNGINFSTISTLTIRTSDINSLRATATRFREELDTAGITDTLAIEATVEAQGIGSISNISSYSIVSHSASGVNSITNTIPFSGGSNLESDASFRSRILARFAGANTGTALGYRSVVLALPDVKDALVVEPGDTLMTRDGSIISTENGKLIVTQPGTGGKVDVYILGENLQDGTGSYIYKEASGTKDPTNSLNNYILGQTSLTPDENLTINSKRLSVLSDGDQIPYQPISNITSVSGSSSGSNFVKQYTENEIIKGNYKLVKDTGYAGGSSFGMDRLVWISNEINLIEENHTKGTFNGVDGLSFTDVKKITGLRQDISVINENSSISSSNREIVILKHSPIRTVNRVFNLSTGERYTILNQNPDGQVGELNTTKNIQISGRTLPTASDVLQVDYVWVREYNNLIDFDPLDPKDKLNETQDSIDWGFSNYIRDEKAKAFLDSYGNLSVTVKYPISRIFSVNTYDEEFNTVTLVDSSKVISGTTNVIKNIHYIKDITQNGAEIYNTKLFDGTYSHTLITLPSDTVAVNGDTTSTVYNLTNVIEADGYDSASILNRKITIFPSTAISSGYDVLVNYVADFLELLPVTDLNDLPVSSDGYNSFTSVDGYQPVQDLFQGRAAIENVRRSPSQLNISVSGIPNSGTIKIVGTTFNKIDDVYTATADDTFDLSSLIRTDLGLDKTAPLPVGVYVGRVISLQKVQTDSSGNILSVDNTYDLTNYSINNNRFDLANALEDNSLKTGEIKLSNVLANTAFPVTTGSNIHVVFYYIRQNDIETTYFSKSGSFISVKTFAKIGSIDIASGFTNSADTISGNISIKSLNQPNVSSPYFTDYNYSAPKENERITINYEYNKLIQDATFEVENTRPITSDVLVKEATKIELDVIAKIIVLPSFESLKENVKQDVSDNISSTLSSVILNTTIDVSDIINNAYNVAGLDRIIITKFNKKDQSGTKNSISAQKNEYFAAGSIIVSVESR